jgi:hypothetical protein
MVTRWHPSHTLGIRWAIEAEPRARNDAACIGQGDLAGRKNFRVLSQLSGHSVLKTTAAAFQIGRELPKGRGAFVDGPEHNVAEATAEVWWSITNVFGGNEWDAADLRDI